GRLSGGGARDCRRTAQALTLPLSFYCHAAARHDIYTLSLHDALPISGFRNRRLRRRGRQQTMRPWRHTTPPPPCGFAPRRKAGVDRKSTRLNSSHVKISYAVFCLKKKKTTQEKSSVVQSRLREAPSTQ